MTIVSTHLHGHAARTSSFSFDQRYSSYASPRSNASTHLTKLNSRHKRNQGDSTTRSKTKIKSNETDCFESFREYRRLKTCQALVLCSTNSRLHRSEQSIGGCSTYENKFTQHTEQIFKANFLKNQTLSETIFVLYFRSYHEFTPAMYNRAF